MSVTVISTVLPGHGAAGNGEPLAIVLRAGNAGSSTAADHVEAARLALAQLPRHLRRKVLVRADSGGGTHEFLKWLTARSRRLRYSVGMTITEEVQAAILKVGFRYFPDLMTAILNAGVDDGAGAGRVDGGVQGVAGGSAAGHGSWARPRRWSAVTGGSWPGSAMWGRAGRWRGVVGEYERAFYSSQYAMAAQASEQGRGPRRPATVRVPAG